MESRERITTAIEIPAHHFLYGAIKRVDGEQDVLSRWHLYRIGISIEFAIKIPIALTVHSFDLI